MKVTATRYHMNSKQPNIFKLYEDNIGFIVPMMRDILLDAEQEYPEAWIQRAFQLAVKRNARNWSYIQAILERWKTSGFDSGNVKRKREYNADDERAKLRESWAKLQK